MIRKYHQLALDFLYEQFVQRAIAAVCSLKSGLRTLSSWITKSPQLVLRRSMVDYWIWGIDAA
jgi:hypothetical protein